MQSIPQGVSVLGRYSLLLSRVVRLVVGLCDVQWVSVSGEEMGAGTQSIPQGVTVLDRRSPLLSGATRLWVE